MFTVEQGERAQERTPRRSEAPTSRATALVRSPVRGVRVVSTSSPSRLRLAKPFAYFSAPLIGGAIGSVVAAVTPGDLIGWTGAIVGAVAYVVAYVRYQPTYLSIDEEGLDTGVDHLALGELDRFRAERRRTKEGYLDFVLVTTKRGKLVELALAASLEAAEDVAARLTDELARLRGD